MELEIVLKLGLILSSTGLPDRQYRRIVSHKWWLLFFLGQKVVFLPSCHILYEGDTFFPWNWLAEWFGELWARLQLSFFTEGIHIYSICFGIVWMQLLGLPFGCLHHEVVCNILLVQTSAIRLARDLPKRLIQLWILFLPVAIGNTGPEGQRLFPLVVPSACPIASQQPLPIPVHKFMKLLDIEHPLNRILHVLLVDELPLHLPVDGMEEDKLVLHCYAVADGPFDQRVQDQDYRGRVGGFTLFLAQHLLQLLQVGVQKLSAFLDLGVLVTHLPITMDQQAQLQQLKPQLAENGHPEQQPVLTNFPVLADIHGGKYVTPLEKFLLHLVSTLRELWQWVECQRVGEIIMVLVIILHSTVNFYIFIQLSHFCHHLLVIICRKALALYRKLNNVTDKLSSDKWTGQDGRYYGEWTINNTNPNKSNNNNSPIGPIMNQFSQPDPSTDIPTKIVTQIEQGLIDIPKTATPLTIAHHPMHSHSSAQLQLENSRQEMIKKIRMNKDKTIKELSQLEEKEKELKRAILQLQHRRSRSRSGSHSRSRKKEKSQFTEQEKRKIKQIIRETKIKEQLKKKRNQSYLDNYTNSLKKQKEQQSLLIEKLRQQHKKAVQHNLQTLEMRKKKREESKKEISRRMLELKQKKYIHLAKAKEDQQKKNKQQDVRQKKLSQIKQRYKLDFHDITEHGRKYRKIVQQKTQQRRERYQTQAMKDGPSSSRKYEKTIFNEILEQEQRMRKIELLRKQNKAKQMRYKIDEFKNLVKEKFLPRQKSQSKSQSKSTSPEKRSVQALSFKQRVDQGNQYLKLAKKLRKQRDDPRLVTQPQIVKYVDYLKNMNKKSKRSGTVQQFRSIVNTQQSIDFSSAERAKNLVDEIEAKSKKTKDDRLIESIQNKIDLLKVLL